jgi:iron complex outermembrane receptor protein
LIKLTAGFIESVESMIKRVRQFSAFIVLSIYSFQCWSQVADTVKRQLDEVVITGYLSRQPIAQVPASAAVLDSKTLLNGSQQSLLPVVNIIPGVRMEERSPGSYRLSIRGSLLRSPFGVRNVKMYLNDLPFTDASGNTYLNLIDPVLLQRIEILKGPDGSLFGANSGGVVLLDTDQNDSSSVRGGLSGGSYGLFREHVLVSNARREISLEFW